ncbi:MAG TPA: YkgJ family cysteine cluster protein [Candidatus Methanoperedens sp.]
MHSLKDQSAMNCDTRSCNSLCCTYCPVLTQDEVNKLAADVKQEYGIDLEFRKYFRQARGKYGTYYAARMIKGQCIFLNKEKRCRIYRCRPVLCELYPVIDVDSVDRGCPQVKENKLSHELLALLKKRYAAEIDERIRTEQTFTFI